MRRLAAALVVVALAAQAERGDANGRAPAPPVRQIEATAIAGWHALRDRQTGVALRLWGRSLPVPGASADPAIAERAARAFIATHRDALAPGTADGDLELVANRVDGPLRTIGFRQRWHGLVVVGGQVSVVFERDRLFVVGSEALPNVTARSDRGDVVLPVAGGYRVANQRSEGADDVFVDPTTGAEIARRRRARDAGTATLTFNAAVRYPAAGRADYPAGDAPVTVAGVTGQTAADGTFSWAAADPVMVTPGLTGALVAITNAAGAPATITLPIADGGTAAWSLAADELGDAQLAAYIHAMIGKAHTHVIEPAIDAWTNTPIAVYVNEAGPCGASSTADELHFSVADATCENTGRLADVVFHEYGHAQHRASIIAGVGAFDTALSEGLADFNAADINDDSGVGRGLYYSNDPLRDIDPPGLVRVYPADLSEDPHLSGEIISGALWDLRRTGGVALAQQIFVGVMQRAADIPSSYIAALTADDDDGDLSNGTPNECLIRSAFGIHGLADAAFVTTTVGAPVVDGLAITVPVTTPPLDPTCPAPTVTAIAIDWAVGDGPHATVALTTGDGASWTGAIPPQPDDTLVTYTVTATLSDGRTIGYPNNPADPRYELWVGALTPIWCESFATDPHWPQTGSAGNEWAWGPPGDHAGAPDPTTAYDGSDVYGTDVAGTGLYPASDTTFTATPAIDVSGYRDVRLQYRRWLTVEDATYDQATIAVNGTTLWQNPASAAGTLELIDREWRFHDLDLGAQAAAGTVTVRWSLTSDPSLELGGWTLDDVCIVGSKPGGGGCQIAGDRAGSSPSALVLIVAAGLTACRRRRGSP